MLSDPADPSAAQETAQPQEQDPSEEVEPPQEPTETSASASRPTRGQQAFITLSDEELAGLDFETPDIQPDIDGEPAPAREAYSGSHIDIELEPPTIQLFDEYRRVTDSVGERSAVRFDAISDDEFDRIVSRTIDIEMPLHLALLRDRMADTTAFEMMTLCFRGGWMEWSQRLCHRSEPPGNRWTVLWRPGASF
jgi:hypothetical protein